MQTPTVRELVDGAENIDKMRLEIARVVGMLIKNFNGMEHSAFTVDGHSDSGINWWVHYDGKVLQVICKYRDSAGSELVLINYPTVKVESLSIQFIQPVHQSLEVPIHYLFEQSYELQKKIEPLVKASKVQL